MLTPGPIPGLALCYDLFGDFFAAVAKKMTNNETNMV